MNTNNETQLKNYHIIGLSCMDCIVKIEGVVSKLNWVKEAKVNFSTSQLKVIKHDGFTDETLMNEEIGRVVKKIGFSINPERINFATFNLGSKMAEVEKSKVQKKISSIRGVTQVNITGSGSIKVGFNPEVIQIGDIKNRFEQWGIKVKHGKGDGAKSTLVRDKRLFVLTLLSFAFIFAGLIIAAFGIKERLGVDDISLAKIFYCAAMVSGIIFIGQRGLASIWHLRMDINFLMSIAVIGSACIGEWLEGASIVFLFMVAQLLETFTMDKARNAIQSLIELSPKEALVKSCCGGNKLVPVDSVKVSDIIIIKPGDRIPLDGVVINGQSAVNQAAVTGESIPVEKSPGNSVYAGTINEKGALEVKVSCVSKESTLAKIIDLIVNAQSQKAPYQSFVDTFAKYYTPVVIFSAILIALIPPFFLDGVFVTWFYRALVLLVISCPCSLVISTPVSLISGITRAARKGVLFKGGVCLEQIGGLKAIAFDKTGTLTVGKPSVTDIVCVNMDGEDELLRLAASIEVKSEHSIGNAVVEKAKSKGLKLIEGDVFESVTGKGAFMTIKNRKIYIGNTKYFNEVGFRVDGVDDIVQSLRRSGKSVVLLGRDKTILGVIAVSDEVRKMGRQTVKDLYNMGIKKIVMLTGDHENTARAICNDLEIKEFVSELSPEGKVDAVKELLKGYGKTGMVGDGVNDAPALASATVGVGMGRAGSDITLESSDVVLMGDDLSNLPFAIKLGKRTMGTIKQNIFFSIFIKCLFLGLAVPGFATLWMAVGADMGASLIVILNGLRLLGVGGNKDKKV